VWQPASLLEPNPEGYAARAAISTHLNPVPRNVAALASLYASFAGAVRFNEFKQALRPIPPRTLAQRLVELEEAGVLERVVVDARPPRAEYRLTSEGRRLTRVVEALVRFASGRPTDVR
jgi:DNA-binding HxlR family transcriptional regulator